MAQASDARLAKGEAGPLEGLPIGVKDLYATKGVHTQACSHILDGFKPPYESTVTAQSLARRRGDARQAQHGRVRDGLVERDVLLRPRRLALAAAQLEPRQGARGARGRQARPADARRLLRRIGLGRRRAALPRGDRERHRRLDPPARRLHRHCRHQADLWPLLALRHGRLRLVARSGGTDRAHCARRRDHAALDGRTRPEGFHLLADAPVPDYEAAVGRSVKGLTIGVPKEYRLDGMNGEIEALWARGAEWLRAAGASIVDVSLPHTRHALPAYYIVAPAEASSNLARYDGVRYGLREPGADITDLYEKTRARGFGAEVRRRLMIGTYVLSAGYYDAYYVRAQKIRTLIKRDFETRVRRRRRRDPDARHAVGRVRHRREGLGRSGRNVSQRRLHGDGQHGGSAGPCRARGLSADGLPLGLQLIGRPFDEETLFALGEAIEQSAGRMTLPEPGGREAPARSGP